MIARLHGTVIRKNSSTAVIDVSGVGYLVQATGITLDSVKVGEVATLEISQVFREDAVLLFGFRDIEELQIFETLCTVNGVGPKSALLILNHLGVNGVVEAVAKADDNMFRSVSGIGPKTAKLIVLSLTGKLVLGDTSEVSEVTKKVLQALVNLGYSEKVAKDAIKSLDATKNDLSEQELLKLALAQLSSSRKVGKDA